MSSIEHRDAFTFAATRQTKPRRLRAVLAMLMLQYAMVAILVCVAAFYIVRYMVTPQIVARLEVIVAALKREP
jgi:putative flippase GtrA